MMWGYFLKLVVKFLAYVFIYLCVLVIMMAGGVGLTYAGVSVDIESFVFGGLFIATLFLAGQSIYFEWFGDN